MFQGPRGAVQWSSGRFSPLCTACYLASTVGSTTLKAIRSRAVQHTNSACRNVLVEELAMDVSSTEKRGGRRGLRSERFCAHIGLHASVDSWSVDVCRGGGLGATTFRVEFFEPNQCWVHTPMFSSAVLCLCTSCDVNWCGSEREEVGVCSGWVVRCLVVKRRVLLECENVGRCH